MKFSELPKQILNKCIEEAHKQGGELNLEACTQSRLSEGGFNWSQTELGDDFWNDILNTYGPHDFNSFYKLFPKEEYKFICFHNYTSMVPGSHKEIHSYIAKCENTGLTYQLKVTGNSYEFIKLN